MEENLKQLLIRDLCARLPYGVMYETPYGPRVLNDIFIYSNGPVYTDHGVGNYNEVFGIELENIKPYLRPMSSMTEEEEKEFNHVFELELAALEEPAVGHTIKSAASNAFVIDFYNRHHFDYRGLIEKGLALEAPKDMYIF
jgi:hypothetical protein